MSQMIEPTLTKPSVPFQLTTGRAGPDYLPNMEPEPPAAEVCEGFATWVSAYCICVAFALYLDIGITLISMHLYRSNSFIFQEISRRAEGCSSLTKSFLHVFFLGFAVMMMESLLAAEHSWCRNNLILSSVRSKRQVQLARA